MKALIYDLEIKRAIPDRKTPNEPGVLYCEGWHDHAGMGISVLAAYDMHENRWRIFCDDNKQEFFDLTHDRLLVSFGGIAFDNQVIAKNWDFLIPGREDFCYDILKEIWIAAGLAPTFQYPSHLGYSLDAVVKANGIGTGKTGSGARAPIDWQHGKIGAVHDYCLQDVKLTLLLFEKIMRGESLESPKGGILTLRIPTFPSD